MLKRSINKILNLIFPEKCFGCGIDNFLLCPKCIQNLPPAPHKNDDILAATSYKSQAIKKAIKVLKYKKSKRVAKPLAEIIYKKINFSNCGGSTSRIIIPVPLSGKRFRERGFNQTELIARHLSDKLKPNFSVLNNVLYKNKDTISQVEIKNRKERLRNLKNTFSVKNSGLIKNEVIFVLDDVTTTSATINEARRALLKAGAKKVIGLVVAR